MGGMLWVMQVLFLPTIFLELLAGNLHDLQDAPYPSAGCNDGIESFIYPCFGQCNRSNRGRQWLRPQLSK
jgi:hypothetical protein